MGDSAGPKGTELCATVDRGKSVSKWPKPSGLGRQACWQWSLREELKQKHENKDPEMTQV